MDVKQKQRNLRKSVQPFERADVWHSIVQLVNTIGPFALVWFGAYWSMTNSLYYITVPCVLIGAFLLTRIFIIFHDCTHNSFFPKVIVNQIVGTVTGVMTYVPFSQWKHEHTIHHATSGNLDKRGTGDIWVMTIEEYETATPFEQLKYRLYRSPLVMFGLGPIWIFLIMNRFNRKDARSGERMNTYLTNLLIIAKLFAVYQLFGWEAIVFVEAPIIYLAGMLGIWLFYVQHNFEDSYFEPDARWEYVSAAVEGSSFYRLPKVLQWLTGNIGYHHVHHLSPRVPNYKLEDAHEASDDLKHVPTITLKTSLSCINFRLWDEENKRFVTFREAARLVSLRKQVS
ncbi:MAG: fatty acid desaturase [Bacilli bacterium]